MKRNKSKVYVIYHSSGEYDDYFRGVIGYVKTLKQAKDYVTKAQKVVDRFNEERLAIQIRLQSSVIDDITESKLWGKLFSYKSKYDPYLSDGMLDSTSYSYEIIKKLK